MKERAQSERTEEPSGPALAEAGVGKKNILVTPRDREILRHLSQVRLLNTSQVAELVAPGLTTDKAVVRRLALLRQGGYVYRLPNQQEIRLDPYSGRYAGKNKMVYALGSVGARFLDEEEGHDPNWSRVRWEKKNSEIKDTQIKHALMVSGVYVALHSGLEHVPNMELHDWNQGYAIQNYFYTKHKNELVSRPNLEEETRTLERRPVYPDAYLCLLRTDARMALPCFLEADRGTMEVKRFVKEKVENYLLWKQFGLHTKAFKIQDFWVLTVTHTESRRDTLRKATVALCPDTCRGMFRFASETEYTQDPKNFVGHIWFLPGTEEKRFNLFN